MTDKTNFAAIENVVADDLRFRLMLGIGEDAYTSLRLGKTLQQLWDVGGAAATGAGIAASSRVATTLFGGGILQAMGLATAVTPIGWVIASSVVSAGAYWGVMRLVGGFGQSRVAKIPHFINTPVDLLGVTLTDMIGTLALRLAAIDGHIATEERNTIIAHLVHDWGIDRGYAQKAMLLIEENLDHGDTREAARTMGQFLRESPDCNQTVLRDEMVRILTEVMDADGRRDEREELAIEKITALLFAETSLSVSRSLKSAGTKIGSIFTKKADKSPPAS